MNLLDKDKINDRLDDIYEFLRSNNNKWLRNYFPDKNSFYGFLHDDDDITILSYENDSSEITCVGLLMENSILTVSFSDELDNEQGYDNFFGDVEKLLASMHYTSVYFGEGYYSFGLYDGEYNKNFDDYLERIGFSVESVRYDIRHMVKSLKIYDDPKRYEVYKFDFESFKNNFSLSSSNQIIEDILLNFYKFPSDICYVGIKKGASSISGFVLLDMDSDTMDAIVIKEKNPLDYKRCKKELLSSIANDLDLMGIHSIVEPQVDQLDGQRLSGDFEVCGKYKTMSKGIKK